MSSASLNLMRKRGIDFDSSDSDSEDDIGPVRKIRRCHQETSMFPNYLLYIKHTLTSQCRSIWQWLSDLPLKDYIKDMYRPSISTQSNDVIVIDDDDDDNVISMDDDNEEDDEISVLKVKKNSSPMKRDHSCWSCKKSNPEQFLNGISKENLYLLKNKPRRTLSDFNDAQCALGGSKPFSTSTPLYRDYKSNYKRFDSLSDSLCRKRVNGFDSKKWTDKNGGNFESTDIVPLRNSGSGRHISPITNPGIDVEILLDGKSEDTTGDDSDELEIISEVAPVKQKPGPLCSKKMISTVKVSRTVKDRTPNFKDSKMNRSACTEKKTSNHVANNSYAAHEVVRLQEKEQYKLLLDKIVNTSVYHPLVSKSGSRCAEVQIDLTEDDEPIVGCHFKKEVLKQPVTEFLQKYYKPCHLVTPSKLNRVTLIGGIKDEVHVMEKKPPEYKHLPEKSGSDFFSDAWIAELKMTISSETEKRLHYVAEQEKKLERFRKRRDAKIAEENRLRDELALRPTPRVEEEFPALTEDMELIIDSALDPSTPNPCLVKLDNLTLSTSDMVTLHGLNWLNDQIINFYLALIVERSKLDNYPSVYAYSSFFYSSLRTRGEAHVSRWTKKVDIFAHDILFVPLHLGMHWALAVIDNRTKTIQYYDSLRCQEERCLQSLQKYLVAEMKDKKKITMDPNTYATEVVKNIPQQMNGSDCGMFTLKYAEYISRDAEITFTQVHMQYFRRRMVYEMLTKQLFT